MGNVISLARERAVRAASGHQPRPRATFYFDLTSPFTYLAAERVDRHFGDVDWRPVLCDALPAGTDVELAQTRAEILHMPLVWPERYPSGRAAMRVAAMATEEGRAAPFALAAGRLAFCGGFDLDDPEILAEAAAAAGIRLDECLRAAGDARRDGVMEAAGRRLLAAGADRLPVLRIGRSLFWGEQRVGAAAAAVRQSTPALARG
jgi:2-hydroxychromene-2-carboxylate isomerase